MKHHWSLESGTLVMLLFVTLLKSINSTSDTGCSCYTFETNSLNWAQSDEYCKNKGGNLVSMETQQEYQFINKAIQSINKNRNEWYIGLTRKTVAWKWINGRSLSINKWQPKEPSGDGTCVVMAKNWPLGKYGLFNDLSCGHRKMFICEYNTGQPCGQQSISHIWCHPTKITTVTAQTTQYFTTAATSVTTNTHKPSTTSSATTSLPTSQLITPEQISPTWPFTAIHNKPTTKKDQMDTTFTTVEDERSPRSTSQKSPKFQMVIVVAVLGVLLAVSVCLLVFACYWKRRKRADKQEIKNRDTTEDRQLLNQCAANSNSTEGVQMFHQNSGKPYVTYAVISNNLTRQNDENQAKCTSKEPTYASIEDKKGLKWPCGLENGPNAAIPAVTASREEYFVDSVGGIKSNMEVVYASVNKEKVKSQDTSNEGMTKSIKNSNQDGKQCPAEQQVLYACADKSKMNNTRPKEVLYAEIARSNAEGQQPSQITYAELMHFNQNPPKKGQKPALYQQTVYAAIDQNPKS